MEKRLEAGWFQRMVWASLVWLSVGMLAWVPFLYVAIRRGRPSDWGALASLAVYEVMTVTGLSVVPDDGPASTVMGIVIIACLMLATAMLLFAVFDKRTPRPLVQLGPMPYGTAPMAPAPPQGPYGYPYGR
ncbi:hypothetical protein RKE30_37245 [Streptomyces sp. Li-HN-5-11]|uniref:hypothetical protein n=1 Tax=Streptomyces sp. Li-HN-5-11 TaxID=3075432 RepID=UPI0028AB4EBF|nr:hypothetical protein [Streptomyces sp. Li-HN-5-11]WNM35605.1 hypothetical protein RKE30_37245 [Streptomyces sp. Li-HN-5-11]